MVFGIGILLLWVTLRNIEPLAVLFQDGADDILPLAGRGENEQARQMWRRGQRLHPGRGDTVAVWGSPFDGKLPQLIQKGRVRQGLSRPVAEGVTGQVEGAQTGEVAGSSQGLHLLVAEVVRSQIQ